MDTQRYSPSMHIGHGHRSLTNMLRLILRCPHCSDILDQPTTLMCGHTVCSNHVAANPGNRNSSASPHQPRHPSCPILTCFTPTGARPLRPRDDDEQSPTVIYHPPPTEDPAYQMPPPPSAQIKIDNPKQDVTLSRVIRVLTPFLDILPSPPTSHPEMPYSTSSDAAIAHGVGTMAVGPDDSPSLPQPLIHGTLSLSPPSPMRS
ncbi:hypothetical protein BS47DRAFT_804900 [Hydnum rufescens UP504]|uniref:RING-type domain-containing protein n=1 Tax=Hydnum rufescens UP504 TaxID=1448309 RepID=A0A9P6B082_9AGAM|nr:hypothetical protein BS47DRAFT_804900 [Hydnum rufescens UP504]